MGLLSLKAAREARNWTVDELAARSGVGRATVYRLESGETPNPSHGTVGRLEDALEVPRGSLRFGVDRPAVDSPAPAVPMASAS